MIGFTNRIIAVSTFMTEIGQELFGFDEYRGSLGALTVSSILGKLISVGDNT